MLADLIFQPEISLFNAEDLKVDRDFAVGEPFIDFTYSLEK